MNNSSIVEIDFNKEIDTQNIEEKFKVYPTVYILANDKKMYIGETANIRNRIKSHQKLKKSYKLKKGYIIFNSKFNKSATYNIETNLINYMIADNKYELINESQTKNKYVHNYFDKEYYDKILFREIWENLIEKGITDSTIDDLENRDVYKLSPFKELSLAQLILKERILEFCEENINKDKKSIYRVKGGAGSGKSVVISSLYNTIQEASKKNSSPLYGTENFLLVNHEEVLKTFQKLSKSIPVIKKGHILKPTTFINKYKKSDIVIIDEGHLLLTKSDNFNSFEFDNQLEEIIKRANIVIFIYDDKQYLKYKSYWNEKLYKRIVSGITKKEDKLNEQFRMNTNNSTNIWIDMLIDKNITSLKKDSNYDIRIFEDFKEMHNQIKLKNEKYGLARVVSTFDYIHKKDGKLYYINESGYKLPWNNIYPNETWAEVKQTIDEVGSIYTIQGFDLNYVGVVLGPTIGYDDKTSMLVIDSSKYCDVEAFRGLSTVNDANMIKEQIILNSLNVLLKRGIKGLYIYCHDKQLERKLKEIINNN